MNQAGTLGLTQIRDFRFRVAGRAIFGGSLVLLPIEAARCMAFGQVKFVLDLLLPTHQRGQAFGVFKRRFDLDFCVREALAGVGQVLGEIRGGLIEVLDGVFDRTDRPQRGFGDVGGVSARAFDYDLGTAKQIVRHEKTEPGDAADLALRLRAANANSVAEKQFTGDVTVTDILSVNGGQEVLTAGVAADSEVAPRRFVPEFHERNLVYEMPDADA